MKKLSILILLLSFWTNASEITLTGTVVSDGQKMIGSKFMGYITKVYVEIGDRVEKGDKLYEMESAEYDIMKMEADLMLENSKIIIEHWRERVSGIKVQKSKLRREINEKNRKITFDKLDDLDALADNFESMLSAAQSMVKQSALTAKKLTNEFNYIKLNSPSSGIVVRRNIKAGDMVMPGMLTIMLVDMEELEINISVSEGTLSRIKEGQEVPVEIPSLNYKTIGKIHAIVPAINPMSHQVRLRITFDKGDLDIFPGMYAKVLIK